MSCSYIMCIFRRKFYYNHYTGLRGSTGVIGIKGNQGDVVMI